MVRLRTKDFQIRKMVPPNPIWWSSMTLAALPNSEWPVLNRPRLAGFQVTGDNHSWPGHFQHIEQHSRKTHERQERRHREHQRILEHVRIFSAVMLFRLPVPERSDTLASVAILAQRANPLDHHRNTV